MDLSVSNLNLKNRNSSSSCIWNLTGGKANNFLFFNRFLLNRNDSLTVVSFHKKDNQSEVKSLFKTVDGVVPTGLLPISDVDYSKLQIILNISQTSFDRVFSVQFFSNSSKVTVSEAFQTIQFPLYNNVDNVTAIDNFKFQIEPSSVHIEQNLMVMISNLPKNYWIKVNNEEFDSVKNPLPSVYYKSTKLISVELAKFNVTSTSAVSLTYFLVSANCSKTVQLSIGQSVPIAYPDSSYRKSRNLQIVNCVTLATRSAKDKGAKFVLTFDPKQSTLLEPYDILSVTEEDVTKLALPFNLKSSLNSLNYFFPSANSDQLIVSYDSYSTSVSNEAFIPPKLSLSTQDGEVTLTSGQSFPWTADLTSQSKVVHIVRASNSSKRVNVGFNPNQVYKPGQYSIKVYDSIALDSLPIYELGQQANLPFLIPSNSDLLRVEYINVNPNEKGVKFDMIYSETSSSTCNTSSLFAPTFNLTSIDQDQCSWLVWPSQDSDQLLTINLFQLPKGVKVSCRKLSEGKTTDLVGPRGQSPAQQIVLPSGVYEFVVIKTDPKATLSTQPRISVNIQDSYLQLQEQFSEVSPSEKNSLSSVNYPGQYPVGIIQTWIFNQTFALITLNDLQLAGTFSYDFLIFQTHFFIFS